MNKREAERLADEDTTTYGVFWRGKSGGAGMAQVTGYRNAKIFRKGCGDGAVILTKSEIERVRKGWRPA